MSVWHLIPFSFPFFNAPNNLKLTIKSYFRLFVFTRKASALLLMFFLSIGISFSQNALNRQVEAMLSQGKTFPSQVLFTFDPVQKSAYASAYNIDAEKLRSGLVVFPAIENRDALLDNTPQRLRLSLPELDGEVLTLLLFKKSPLSPDFIAYSSSRGLSANQVEGAAFYRGVVQGHPVSLASLSILDNEIRIMVTLNGKSYTVGRIPKAVDGAHIYYRNEQMEMPDGFKCELIETHDDAPDKLPSSTTLQAGSKTLKCVRLRVEIDNGLVTTFGGEMPAVNYILGLFNEVTTLFENDDISVVVSELFTWVGSSPYSGTLANRLGQLNNNSPNADLTTLITNTSGGGIAYLSSVCSSNFGVSVSGIFGFYNNLPNYSWDVNVCAHELGHNLSSPHTHACAWNGNNTPLDGCGIQAGFPEGNCGSGSIPLGGGTIMSYCHLLSTGVNFSNGFGAQPTTRMVNYINSRSCLGTTCPGIVEESDCVAPYPQVVGLTTVVQPNGVLLSWDPIPGSLGCQIQGGIAGSTALTLIQVNEPEMSSFFIPPSQLPVNDTYRVRVRCGCSLNPPVAGAWTSFQNFNWNNASGLMPQAENSFAATNERLEAFPNPSQGALTVQINAQVDGIMYIRLYDMQGKMVFAESKAALAGANQFNFDFGNLPESIYLLQVGGDHLPVQSTRVMLTK
jgi:hypothetical protein